VLTFNCKVRLKTFGTDTTHTEVRKCGVTAPEIVVLRAIHNRGDEESITEIKSTGKEAMDEVSDETGELRAVVRSDRDERRRLDDLYGGALRTIEEIRTLTHIFPTGVPLPKTVEGAENIAITEMPKRTKVPPPAPEVTPREDVVK
jgi:hypothetical protein